MNGSKSYQVAVIGSGAAGRQAAFHAARNGLRVVLVESDGLGGTSFHRGYYSVRAFRACVEVARDRSKKLIDPETRPSQTDLPDWVNPQIASVGWTEEEAARAGLCAIAHTETSSLVTEDQESIFNPVPVIFKILVDAESRKILGVHAIGHHAAELVNSAALAIRSEMTIEDLDEITFVHPSAAEALQQCSANLHSLPAG